MPEQWGFVFECEDGFLIELACDDLYDAMEAIEARCQGESLEWDEQATADGCNDDGEQCWKLQLRGDDFPFPIGQLTWIGKE